MTVEPEPHEVATADRQTGIERTLLGHVPDVVTPAPRRPAVDLDDPARQPRQPEEHTQQRRLPRSVRAEDREELARRELEAEMFEQHARAELHRRIMQADGGGHPAPSARRSSSS